MSRELIGRNGNEMPEFIDVRLSMPWGEIAGRWYGSRKVRPILALHGWLDNLGSFNNLIPLLPKHIGVLCFDMPGHGQSSKLPKGIMYHGEDYIALILRIMRAYEWDKVSLLSHSMSARVAIGFATLYPKRVDMLITIDIVRPDYRTPEEQIEFLAQCYEKILIEDDRLENTQQYEPPSYSRSELTRVLYEGSNQSVSLENTHHVLDRNIKKSTLYPDKYYFSRDGRIKYYMDLMANDSISHGQAERMKSVPFCVIKGADSPYIKDDDEEFIKKILETNPYFEFHVVKGTHHVHLNNAAGVAAIVNPFISHYRPPLLEKWSVDEVNPTVNTGHSATVETNTNQYQKYRSKL